MPEEALGAGDLFEPRMPESDERPGIEKVFDQARTAAASGTGPQGEPGRSVVLVTPGSAQRTL